MQIDYVEHCGSSAAGEFVCTIDSTCIASGWEEWEAVMGRGQFPTKEGLDRARFRSPFSWIEIHSDTDKGFVNAHLVKYSEETNLGFSRSRPYKKNDNCYVEQKNYTVLRRFLGYGRYETDKQLFIIKEMIVLIEIYVNFLQPVMKLVAKERIGNKVKKKYDTAKTPYQRLLLSGVLNEEQKQQLGNYYETLNPMEILRQIRKLQQKLYKTLR